MICLVLIIFASIFHTGWMTTVEEEERTLVLVNPDGVQRRLVGEIIQRFERKGFQLVALKMMLLSRRQASEDLLKELYPELTNKPFFSGLIEYMTSGPVVAMVWQGQDVVETTRAMIGATIKAKAESAPGTIRGDYDIQASRNVIHSSESVEKVKAVIAAWFPKEIMSWVDCSKDWIYE